MPDIEDQNGGDLPDEETENLLDLGTNEFLSPQEENEEYDFLYKVMLVGDSGTGKSSIFSCLCRDCFSENYIPTIKIEVQDISFHINNYLVKLQICDTAGQEQYRAIIPTYYNEANIILIAYNPHNRQKFEHVVQWLEKIDTNASENCQVVLLENEFKNCERQVSEHEGPELANKFELHFYKINAQNAPQIQSLFSYITNILLNSANAKRPNYKNIIEKYSMIDEKKTHFENNNHDYLINFIIIGDPGTGKSSLLSRYSDDVFSESYHSTIGIDFKVCSLKIVDKVVKLQIYDTAGEERLRAITFFYYKSAHVIMIVYDASNRQSFDNLGYWVEAAHKYAGEFFLICLVEHSRSSGIRQVESFEGENFARRENLEIFKVNARTKEGVDELFEKCTQKAMEVITK